jgi:hypothetical protein
LIGDARHHTPGSKRRQFNTRRGIGKDHRIPLAALKCIRSEVEGAEGVPRWMM